MTDLLASFACSTCGGDVPAVRFERSVGCPYCKSAVPNLRCLSAGDEVMVPHDTFRDQYRLGRVLVCDGPDAINVQVESKFDDDGAEPVWVKLEDVFPVVLARDIASERMTVYAKQLLGWERTVVRNIGEQHITVQNPKMPDPFFDHRMDFGFVRVAADPRQRICRTRLQALGDRLRADPMKAAFTALLLGMVLTVVTSVLYALFG